MTDLQTARSFLFVPGDRPERFDKAVASGADVVIIDLEDAVAPERKDSARQSAAEWLAAGGRACVRVNAADSPWFEKDVSALAGLAAPQHGLLGVVLPKADDPGLADSVATRTGAPVIALVESALGMVRAHDLAAAPGVARLAFGHLDYAVDLGSGNGHEAMLLARSTLVLASRAAGLPGPIDGVTTALEDPELLAEDLRHARDLGLTGKLLIHPRQVEPTHTAHRPSPEEVAWAQRVIEAAAAGGAVRVDGAMVDAPVVARAEDILTRAAPPPVDPPDTPIAPAGGHPMTESTTRTEVIAAEPVEALAAMLEVRVPFTAGAPVPPLWHWMYLLDRRLQSDLGTDGHPTSGIPAPPEPGRRRMFAGGRVTTYSPLVIGEPATKVTSISQTVEKEGRTGPLTFVTVLQEISQGGATVIREEQDIVYRAPGTGALPPAPQPPTPPAGPTLQLAVDERMLFRFSALTYNTHRIHYDLGYVPTEGYDGLVIHGPLQALLMGDHLRREGIDLVGQTYGYRLVSPMVGPQTLTIVPGPDGLAHGAESRSAAGAVCATSTLTDPA